MKRLAIILALATSPAFAQQPQPTAAEMRGMAQALAAQVDALRELHLQASAKASALAEENAALKKQIEDLKKPPQDSPK